MNMTKAEMSDESYAMLEAIYRELGALLGNHRKPPSLDGYIVAYARNIQRIEPFFRVSAPEDDWLLD